MKNSKPIVFVHVPKSGGSSIIEMFRRLDGISVSHTLYEPLGKLDEFDFFAGHWCADQFTSVSGSPFIFTFIRNPTERILSSYRFWKSHKDDYVKLHEDDLWLCRLAREYTFDEFIRLEDVREKLDNDLVRRFCGTNEMSGITSVSLREFEIADDNLNKVDFVGVFENFEYSCMTLFSMLGFNPPTLLMENNIELRVLNGSPELEFVPKLLIQDLSLETIEVLDLFTKFDNMLYSNHTSNP
jgi:hypothetical protein